MADFWDEDLGARLHAAHNAPSTQQRGDLYADLVRSLFESLPGVPRSRTKVRNYAQSQEIDVGLWNDDFADGLNFLPNVILIECKNWTEPVSSADVSWFDAKLRQRSLDFGIIFAAHGVTGRPDVLSAARHIIAMALAEGRRILVITSDDLLDLRQAADLIELLKDKLFDLHFSQAGI